MAARRCRSSLARGRAPASSQIIRGAGDVRGSERSGVASEAERPHPSCFCRAQAHVMGSLISSLCGCAGQRRGVEGARRGVAPLRGLRRLSARRHLRSGASRLRSAKHCARHFAVAAASPPPRERRPLLSVCFPGAALLPPTRPGQSRPRDARECGSITFTPRRCRDPRSFGNR